MLCCRLAVVLDRLGLPLLGTHRSRRAHAGFRPVCARLGQPSRCCWGSCRAFMRPFGTHELQQSFGTPSLPRVRLLCWCPGPPLRARGASTCPLLRRACVSSTIGFHWWSMRSFPSEKQLDTMELCGVKASVGAESAGSSQILPLLLAKPLTARPLLLANGRSAARGALRGHGTDSASTRSTSTVIRYSEYAKLKTLVS